MEAQTNKFRSSKLATIGGALLLATSGVAAESAPTYKLVMYVPPALSSNAVIDVTARSLASNDEVAIYYTTARSPKDRPTLEKITPQRWKAFKPGGRTDFLVKFWSANHRLTSNTFLYHDACYMGDPREVARTYLDVTRGENSIEFLASDIGVSFAEDGKMIGIELDVREPKSGEVFHRHFRMPSCHALGKSVFPGVTGTAKPAGGDRHGFFSAETSTRIPAGVEQEGFTITDQPKIPAELPNLPKFRLRSDFSQAKPWGDRDRPWQGMDISTPEGARRFTELVQAYVYESMANQNPDPNLNFQVERANRYWCHMPWLNQGASRREAIHGLTAERALEPSQNYPDAPPGSDWGVGFYNAVACRKLGEIFGDSANPKAVPDWSRAVLGPTGAGGFPDGTLTAKLLFTTANWPAVKGAFQWHANVSAPNSTARKVSLVNHIQMDIAVKDSTLRGVKGANANWVFTTYYYDSTYAPPKGSPVLALPNLPEGFKRMRPIGIQIGFGMPETRDSVIFPGSKTNQNAGQLNGPADNPKSNCMACHAQAGTTLKMVPGVQDDETWAKVRWNAIDYSQQLALAKRNYETRAKKQ